MSKFPEGALLTKSDVVKAIKLLGRIKEVKIQVTELLPMTPSDHVSVLVDVITDQGVVHKGLFARISQRDFDLNNHADYEMTMDRLEDIATFPVLMFRQGLIDLSRDRRVSVILRSFIPGISCEHAYDEKYDRRDVSDMMKTLRNTCELIGELQDAGCLFHCNTLMPLGPEDWVLSQKCLVPVHFSGWTGIDPEDTFEELGEEGEDLKRCFDVALENMVRSLIKVCAWYECVDKEGQGGWNMICEDPVLHTLLLRCCDRGPKICEAFKMVFTAKNRKEVAEFIKDEKLDDDSTYTLQQMHDFDQAACTRWEDMIRKRIDAALPAVASEQE